ncbi:MAG: hypothetical protein ACK2UK_06290 [Candidatus Promineifilaceae bacterium]|jgi:hypothetical protein
MQLDLIKAGGLFAALLAILGAAALLAYHTTGTVDKALSILERWRRLRKRR